MQKDFHLHAVALLALRAGFSRHEAEIIAKASQYVDDAMESYPIHFADGRILDVTMTAHRHLLDMRLRIGGSLSEAVQRKVYMCFHFPPEGMGLYNRNARFDFKTRRNSWLMRKLMRVIVAGKKRDRDSLGLHRLGVALHTFADSFAHEGFSGRRHRENDVGRLHAIGDEPERLHDWLYDLAPMIGHCECGHYPDQPFRDFALEMPSRDGARMERRERHNPELFREAAVEVLRWLCAYSGRTGLVFDESNPIERALLVLFEQRHSDPDERIRLWKKTNEYDRISDKLAGFAYDPDAWRNAALTLECQPLGAGESMLAPDEIVTHASAREGFERSDFRLFHKAARLQRTFVLNELFW